MRWCLCVGVFILLYHLTEAKPIKPKHKMQPIELIREKRGELEEDGGEEEEEEEETEGGSNEMQKFILDLSTKEDMSRLKERFKTKRTKDVENYVEYRRLKRFSIHDTEEHEQSQSGRVTMEMRSSRTAREDKDVTSPGPSPVTERTTSPSSYDNVPSSQLTSTTRKKRSDHILTRALSQWKDGVEHPKPAGNTGSRSTPDNQEDDSQKNTHSQTRRSNDHSDTPNDQSSTEYKRNLNSPEHGNESDGNFKDSGDGDLGEDDDISLSGGLPINYHLAGESWEIIHHSPRSNTASLPSLMSGNTTMHSEYLQDDAVDDAEEYKRVEETGRRSGASKTRLVRSIEPEYEIQEISAVYKGKTESSDEESAQVIALNKKSIKSNGYIGCFVDKHPNRDLTKAFTVGGLTPASCRSACKEKGHAYAGVQYGYLCHCGDAYGKYGHAAEKECNSVCPGDDGEKCGGFWRNSIYVADIFNKDNNDDDDERESRSDIDRIIPIPESVLKEEVPVRQDITAYLRSYTPERPDKATPERPDKATPDMAIPVQRVGHVEASHDRSKAIETSSKHAEIPLAALQKSKTVGSDQNSYLHPQNIHRSFTPSNIVLKTLKPAAGKKIYTGVVKLKQNWHNNLKDEKSPETLILVGNIESAFREMFATDHDFEKADVLGFGEASIRNSRSTLHKVMVEFALTFKKAGNGKDKKLREMVENSNRLDEMPVFGNTIDVKEYEEEDANSGNEVRKNTTPREISKENELEEDRENGVDPFLEEVFRQIK